MSIISRIVRGVCCAVCICGLAGAVFAQDYPSKPIRLVVPYPPGGSTDIVARIIGQKLTESWGQPVVVDNRAGASGMLGSEIVAKAPPDGYTILLIGAGPYVINPSLFAKVPYDSAKDFIPITLVTRLPLLLVTHPSLPVKSVKELITVMKSKREGFPYASIGIGTPSHLAMELFKSMAQIEKLTHVPYSGSGTAHTALLGGQGALVMFDSVLSSISHVKAGKERVIAVSAAKRLASLPDVPTVAESGLAGFEADTWNGLVGPAGLSAEIARKLSSEFTRILNLPDVQAKLVTQGAIPGGNTPEVFGAFVKTEMAKWSRVIKDANVKAE